MTYKMAGSFSCIWLGKLVWQCKQPMVPPKCPTSKYTAVAVSFLLCFPAIQDCAFDWTKPSSRQMLDPQRSRPRVRFRYKSSFSESHGCRSIRLPTFFPQEKRWLLLKGHIERSTTAISQVVLYSLRVVPTSEREPT